MIRFFNQPGYALVSFVAVAIIASKPGRAARVSADLLPQVQAADVLSDLITWSADQESARADSARAYLKQIGKLEVYAATPEPTTQPSTQPLFYDQLFVGAVQFIQQQGGEHYADPALKKLNEKQLIQELAALQSYNIKEFQYFNQQRALFASLKSYLQSIHSVAAYSKWSGGDPAAGSGPSLPGQAGGQGSQAMITQTEALMQSARAAAEQRAEAAGVSPSDFDKQWDQKQAKLREDIQNRLEGMSSLAEAFAKLGSAKPSPLGKASDGQQTHVNAEPGGQFPFDNPFNTTYQGPGVYRTYDTRINLDDDQRVNGEYDRRAALSFDRRLNIRISPRKGI